jgi:predicted 3-demethylubiquinone-9 3-methyltransferase (glyoxalase superfamily)
MEHAFSFTPAISIYITCKSEEEVDHLYSNLSTDGQVLMPLDTYPFSKKFGWIADRYGVSWQIALS